MKKSTKQQHNEYEEEEEEVQEDVTSSSAVKRIPSVQQLIQAKHVRKLDDEELLKTDDLEELDDYLAPFGTTEYHTDQYMEVLFDKKKVKERRSKQKTIFGVPSNSSGNTLQPNSNNQNGNSQKLAPGSPITQINQLWRSSSTRRTVVQRVNPFLNQIKKGLSIRKKPTGDLNFQNENEVDQETSSSTQTLSRSERRNSLSDPLNQKLSTQEILKARTQENAASQITTPAASTKQLAEMALKNLKPNKLVENLEKTTEGIVQKILGVEDELTLEMLKQNEKYQKEPTEHQNVLRSFDDIVSVELKREVYEHYPLLISISKEIYRLQEEMVDLSRLWAELRDNLNQVDQTTISISKIKEFLISDGATWKNKISLLLPLAEAIQDVSEEMIESIYAKHWKYCTELYVHGVQLIQQLLVVQYGIQQENQVVSQNELIQSSTAMTEFQRVVEWLISSIVDTLRKTNEFSKQKKLIAYLQLLGRTEDAIQTFCKSKLQQFTIQLRNLPSDKPVGSALEYVDLVSQLVFEFILEMGSQFQELFTSDEHFSHFINWMVEALEIYRQKIQIHVFSFCDYDFETVSTAMKIAYQYADVLSSKGIYVKYILEDHFRKDLEHSIINYLAAEASILISKVKQENWKLLSFEDVPFVFETDSETIFGLKSIASQPIRLTNTGIHLLQFLHQFVTFVEPVVTIPLYQPVISGVEALFETVFLKFFVAIHQSMLNDTQFFNLVLCSISFHETVIPRITKEMKRIFQRPIPELQLFETKLSNFHRKLYRCYGMVRTPILLSKMGIEDGSYPIQFVEATVSELDELKVSQPFIKLVIHFGKLVKMIREPQWLELKEKFMLLPILLDKIVEELLDTDDMNPLFANARMKKLVEENQSTVETQEEKEEQIEEKEELPLWNEFHVAQVILDLKFIQDTCKPMLLQNTLANLPKLFLAILREYKDAHQVSLDHLLKQNSTFKSIIEETKHVDENTALQEALEILDDSFDDFAALKKTSASNQSSSTNQTSLWRNAFSYVKKGITNLFQPFQELFSNDANSSLPFSSSSSSSSFVNNNFTTSLQKQKRRKTTTQLDPSKCIAFGFGKQISTAQFSHTVGQIDFYIQLITSKGTIYEQEEEQDALLASDIRIVIDGPSAITDSLPIIIQPDYYSTGSSSSHLYTVSWFGRCAGKHLIHIYIKGKPIRHSPYTISLDPLYAQLDTSTLSVQSSFFSHDTVLSIRQSIKLRIDCKDVYGNQCFEFPQEIKDQILVSVNDAIFSSDEFVSFWYSQNEILYTPLKPGFHQLRVNFSQQMIWQQLICVISHEELELLKNPTRHGFTCPVTFNQKQVECCLTPQQLYIYKKKCLGLWKQSLLQIPIAYPFLEVTVTLQHSQLLRLNSTVDLTSENWIFIYAWIQYYKNQYVKTHFKECISKELTSIDLQQKWNYYYHLAVSTNASSTLIHLLGNHLSQLIQQKIHQLHDNEWMILEYFQQIHELWVGILDKNATLLQLGMQQGFSIFAFMDWFSKVVLSMPSDQMNWNRIFLYYQLHHPGHLSLLQDVMSKRLSNELLKSSANLVLEQQFVMKMRHYFGKSFTYKMEHMLQDVIMSNELNLLYGLKKKKQTMEFTCQILTHAYWHMHFSHCTTDSLLLPRDMVQCMSQWEDLYNDHVSLVNAYGKCKQFNWNYQQDHVELTCHLPNSIPFELHCNSTVAVLLCNCFTLQSAIDIDTMHVLTGLSKESIPQQVKLLLKLKLLIQEERSDGKIIYLLNEQFVSKSKKITLIQNSSAVKKEDESKAVHQEVVYAMEAAIIRLLKKRKQLVQQELLTLISKEMKLYGFEWNESFALKRLHHLKEREFVDQQQEVWIYVP